MENTDAKYKHNRTLDMERLNRLEDNLSLIQSSKISIHSYQPPPPPSFQALNIKVDFPRFDGMMCYNGSLKWNSFSITILLLSDEDFQPPLDSNPPDLSSLTIETLSILDSNENTQTYPNHHLPFNAVGTMCFQGKIQELTVQILLDSGSSDNFIQPRLAQFLKLLVQQASNFWVLVGNGNSLTTWGFLENIQVQIQGHVITILVYLLPITGGGLVLGAWLATLGPHIVDYSSLSLSCFTWWINLWLYLGRNLQHNARPNFINYAGYNTPLPLMRCIPYNFKRKDDVDLDITGSS